MKTASQNIEYLILGGFFLAILAVGFLIVMAYVVQMTRKHNKHISEKMDEVTRLIDADNEVKRTLIDQIKILVQSIKK